MVDDERAEDERVSYKQGADVRAPADASKLPAKASDAPAGPQHAAMRGAGEGERNVSPARPHDAALEHEPDDH